MKLESKLTKHFGICECGYKKEFDFLKDINSNDKKPGLRLYNTFICPECNREYDALALSNEEKERDNKRLFIVAIPILIGIFIFIFTTLSSPSDSEPTFYDTGNPEDMTNEEYQDFLEWKEKQDQKEWENQKVFE